MERGYIPRPNIAGGSSNLSLNQLEYVNDNKMTGKELNKIFKKLGATYVIIVVHKTKLQNSNM